MARRQIVALLAINELKSLPKSGTPIEDIDAGVKSGLLTAEEANNLAHYVIGELSEGASTGDFNKEAKLPSNPPKWFKTPDEG